MDRLEHLGLSLLVDTGPDPVDALAERIRMVLETQPGTLPFEPGFGCDLVGAIGSRADRARLLLVRKRIQDALRRWVPEARVRQVTVSYDQLEAMRDGDARVPTAERVMASSGLSARLRVGIVAETEHGLIQFDAALDPRGS